MPFFKEIGNAFKSIGKSVQAFFTNFTNGSYKDPLMSLINSYTQAGPTGATLQAQEYQTSERESAQNWQASREDTYWQRNVADMQDAGINPMVLAGSGQQAGGSSGQSAPSSSAPASLSDLMSVMLFKEQKKLLRAQADNLEASAVEKSGKSDYWKQRIDESKAKVNQLIEQAKTEEDKRLALQSKALLDRVTSDNIQYLQDFNAALLTSQRALADAKTETESYKQRELSAKASLEAIQKAYQQGLVDNGMCEAVVNKVISESVLAGVKSDESKAAARKIVSEIDTVELVNALTRGDFVRECQKQLQSKGYSTTGIEDIYSGILASMKALSSAISFNVSL